MLLDPLSALSLAGTVVQFVDFTIKILGKGHEIYKSADGSTLDNEDLNNITTDLIGLNERLKASIHNERTVKQLSMDEQALEGVATDCSLIAQELLDHLQKLKIQGKKTKWKSVRQALKNVWNKGDLEEIEDRLARYREELKVHLLVSIREQADLSSIRQTHRFDALDRSAQLIVSYMIDGNRPESKSNMFEQLAGLHGESERKLIREHEKTRSEIRAALQQRDNGSNANGDFGVEFNDDSPIATNWDAANLRQQREMSEIRDSLWFSGINERHEGISEHHKNTFDWIYRDPTKATRPWSNFGSFLKSDDSVYWINGKPGSGKSTLMKYLYDNPVTQEILQNWAEGHELVSAAFFFWNSGSATQKTLESLLRSLLFKALKGKRGCPSLIPIVLEEQLTNGSYKLLRKSKLRWSLPQLKRAFLKLIQQKEIPVKFFFMVDGLDECEDSHDELISFLLKTASPSVKILLSSRPWNVFKDAFTGMPQLRLQDLTSNDIALYVEDNLKKNERMQHLLEKDPAQAEALASEIVSRASGVFLWVRVVVGSLIDGLRNRDRIADLQARLLLLPSDLAEVYQHILSRMSPIYQIHRTKYLLMRRAAGDPPLTLVFSLADEDDLELCFEADIQLMTRGEAVDRCEELERRLEASCAGLIEIDYRKKIELPEHERHRPLTINDYHRTAFGSQVQYLHRTVRDFFESAKYAKQIETIMDGVDFDPNLSLLRAWILRLKVMPLCHFYQFHQGELKGGKGDNKKPTLDYAQRALQDLENVAKTFAQRAEQRTGMKPTKLLRELERTLEQYQNYGSRLQYQQYIQLQRAPEGSALGASEATITSSAIQEVADQVAEPKSPEAIVPNQIPLRRPRNIIQLLFCCHSPYHDDPSRVKITGTSSPPISHQAPKIEWHPPVEEISIFESTLTPASIMVPDGAPARSPARSPIRRKPVSSTSTLAPRS